MYAGADIFLYFKEDRDLYADLYVVVTLNMLVPHYTMYGEL